ncbi:MAG: hypothetical protein Q7R79_01530, partial [bacterium]|nr:hypothetical protein [bacterium]
IVCVLIDFSCIYEKVGGRSLWEVEVTQMGTHQPFFDLSKVKQILKKKSGRDRKRALHLWKQAYHTQKIALAHVYAEIHSLIHRDPDCGIDAIGKIVRTKGLTQFQNTAIMHSFYEYQKRHAAVSTLRLQFRDDRELFAKIFGLPPCGELSIIVGPMTLYFRCHDIRDYTRIYSELFSPHQDITENQIEEAMKSGGVAIFSAPPVFPALEGTLIAEHAGIRTFGRKAEEIYRHEEQHAIFNLMKYLVWSAMNKTLNISFSDLRGASRKHDVSLFRSLLIRYFKSERQKGEIRAQNEILAYTIMGTSSRRIIHLLSQKKEDGGLYDYFRETSKELRVALTRSQCLPKMYDDLYTRVFEKEYYGLVKNSVRAITILAEAGFSPHMCVGLLMAEPLNTWQKVIRRLGYTSL